MSGEGQGEEKGLYGGAMCAFLPPDAKDVSLLRDIPDNQEVFSHACTDQSFIIEIVEFQQVPDQQAAKYHFEDIASSNEAVGPDHCQVECVEQIPLDQTGMHQCSTAWLLSGKQQVAKFNEGVEARNCVNIYLALFRLPQHGTDILVTFNDPTQISPLSSSAQQQSGVDSDWTLDQFKAVLQTLRIVDEGLFA
ncbi:PREDICTED: ran guanine nucleotide release factor-like [Branchiostoma belcheri]|uniref:Ran guanine nucleotide release factor-like n=1 Tax=Branchiostoma belcheri TaxID=7741 RepID=A0A6P4ZPG1_BRABE|nr:PREDICTED: ran guanine nucleotide release factor-like [Branchiostoma belcheri]KAI8500194.1 hypothetical protein Bbelb_217600 [Branchiostoma belcheri]